MADSFAQIVISAVDKTKVAFDSVKSSIVGINGALAGIGLGISIGGLAVLVKDAADFADEMGKAAQRVGTTTAALSGLKYAADLSGVSFEQLQTGLTRLAKTTEDFRDGSKSAVDAFSKIGLDPSNFKDTADLLSAVADQFARLPDGAQKTALAVELFGKSGAQLIPLLNEGAAGLAAFRAEAERFGVVIDDQAAAAAEQFNDNISRLGAIADGFKNSIGNSVIPALVQISEKMLQAAKDGGVLYGILKAIGEAEEIALFGTVETQRKNRKSNLLREIEQLNAELRSGLQRTDMGIVPMTDEYRTQLVMQIRKDALELNTLSKQEASKQATSSASTTAAVSDVVTKAKKTTGASTGKSDAQILAEDTAKLIESFNQAIAPTQSLSDKLAAQLDLYRNLDPGVQAYLQGLVDQAETSERAAAAAQSWNDIIALQQESDAAALADLEALSTAEDAHVSALRDKARAIEELLDPSLKLLDTQAELNEMVEAGVLSSEQAAEALRLMAEETEKTKGFTNELGLTFRSAFEDAIIEGESLRNVLAGIAEDLARLVIRRSITEPFSEAISGLLPDFGNIFGGFRAAGGPVSPGKAYMVGERGPELFMPNTAGSIIPNGAGQSVVVNIDARGADSAAAARIEALAAQLPGIIRGQIAGELRPGGILA